MPKNPIWWEKTVEYSFVLEADRTAGLKFAAPLSGVQEKAGDAVFSADSKIILVEFKRSIDELDSEHDKFTEYKTAVDALWERDNHHFLVYGSSTVSGVEVKLSLHACRYFSRIENDNALEILQCGISETEFRAYLADLLTYKKVDGRSSGTVGPESVAAAVGISSSTSSCSSISLSEYYRIALPSLYQAPSPTHVSTSPIFGMG